MLDKVLQYETVIITITITLFWLVGHRFVRKLDVSKDKKFELTIRNIATVSVFLVIYNIFLSVRSNNRIEKNRLSASTLDNIQRNWLSPQKELVQSFPEGFFLYASMIPDVDFGRPDSMPKQYDVAKRKQLETYYSLRIFQAMEDFLTIGSYDITGKYVWINNFLMWMQSPILRQNWNQLSFNYSVDTRGLVSRLITQSDTLIRLRKIKGKLNPADYDALSKPFYVKFR